MLGVVFACLDYYEYRPKGLLAGQCGRVYGGPSSLHAFCNGGVSLSARNGTLGIVSTVFLVVAAVLTLRALLAGRGAGEAAGPAPLRLRLDVLVAALLGAVLVLVSIASVPRWEAMQVSLAGGPRYAANVEDGHGWSFWIVLVCALACLLLAALRTLLAAGRVGRAGTAPTAYVPPQGHPVAYGQSTSGYLPPTAPPPGSYPPPQPPQAPQG